MKNQIQIVGVVRRSFRREEREEKREQQQQEEAQNMPRILPHASVLQPLAEVENRGTTKLKLDAAALRNEESFSPGHGVKMSARCRKSTSLKLRRQGKICSPSTGHDNSHRLLCNAHAPM